MAMSGTANTFAILHFHKSLKSITVEE